MRVQLSDHLFREFMEGRRPEVKSFRVRIDKMNYLFGYPRATLSFEFLGDKDQVLSSLPTDIPIGEGDTLTLDGFNGMYEIRIGNGTIG